MKTRKSKQKLKKELEESLINGKNHKYKDIDEKVAKIKNCKDAEAVIREFEDIIRTKKNNSLNRVPTR